MERSRCSEAARIDSASVIKTHAWNPTVGQGERFYLLNNLMDSRLLGVGPVDTAICFVVDMSPVAGGRGLAAVLCT